MIRRNAGALLGVPVISLSEYGNLPHLLDRKGDGKYNESKRGDLVTQVWLISYKFIA
jgi:hypothetical protein